MEWAAVHHLDLRHVGRSSKPLQPHAAAFHPTQALVSAAIGSHIIEFDAYTGSKIASVDIGSPVVRMAYSPTAGNSLIAVLEDCTIRSCDFDTEQTCVLHSPEKRTEQISIETEVHLALTPLLPVVFFGFHKKMSVTVVGTVVGGKAPTKIKTDLKKPIVNLACHPRLPVLYVAYQDGLIRAYNINTYAVLYTLQLDNTIRLQGAGAFAFHPTLEWIFVGDRRGTILAWDVSTERPLMIGITQAGSQPITSLSWLPMLRLLVTLSKDGSVQVWKTRVVVNPNRPPMQANFFEPAAIESIDIPRVLSQQGGEAVYPLPRIRALEVHPKLNLATLLFAGMGGGDNRKNRAAYTREGRKQLFAVLQSARGSSASVLKEKLASLGSSGILADHQLQAQLQEHHMKGQSQLTISDVARKAFLYSHFMEGHAKSAPISRLPLISILDSKHNLRDFPICQPFHLELNFFSKENRVLHYPVRAFYIEGANLMAYNITSGSESIYKKLYTSIPGNVEIHPKYIIYSKKQHIFLVVYEQTGATDEVVLYWENTQVTNSKVTTVKGADAAFIGSNENQFAILDEDKTTLSLYMLPGAASQESFEKNVTAYENQSVESEVTSIKGPMQFMFESEVDRIFSTPLESTLLFASHGDQIALGKLIVGYRLPSTDGHYISTKAEGRKFVKLKVNETVFQVQWQETLRGFVAGILTTQRVLIVTADLDVLATLLFSTSTSVNVLGWDGKVRTILSISMPNAVLLGALNDRLLLAMSTDINVRQKKKFEIKNCLVGLLEPLLIGYATMQQNFEQKLDLSEVLYQITSRFDSLRITPRSLDILARGSPVCGDLAVSLSQSGLQFTQVSRGIYAIKSLRFSTALSALKDEFLRSRDYPRCPPTSHLFHRFRQLGYACIRYGQFDSAKETFEVISDFESMLDLFICHLNPSAMRHLAQKLEEEGADSELRRYCERILRVRSTGWTQGIFANFAAESMVPKGREWGGGNWEIKTPTNLKDIPQWALAAEVMPYMKTDDGTIPSIVTDHIGVYLGLVKGRGSVVEVKETSLVKAIKADGGIKANGLEAALATSIPDKPKVSLDGESKTGSLMGLETLSQQFAGSSTIDAQAKAEEEFKKSMYGSAADGSSSDEEETSRTKKLHIRIRDKPVASATVDVNKIKEATKQLRLPIGRTKSLTGSSPDLGSLVPQPAAATTGTITGQSSLPADIFGTNTMALGPPLSQPISMGPGVTARPIPEDFFQNTISSLQVAASLPPAGTVLSRLDQNPQGQGIENNKVPANQGSAPAFEIGLPDGGIPPQATQQPGQYQSFGLPDGGIPPQHSPQPAPFPPQVQMAQLPASSQPLDLSSLEAPGSEASGKPYTRPASPPKSVRPGQVPRGAAAAVCFKTGLAHLEQNQLSDALSCFDEAFLALAKDQSRGADIKAQATISAQYKIAVTLLQEISRLQKVQGPSAISAKDEMARLSRHLGSLPLLAKHRINCIRTAIKRNMDVQNYAYSKQMLELLLSKAPAGKQDELRSLIDMCLQRGMTNKSIDPLEDPSQFCAATLSRLSTIGYDVCDLCGAKFSALSAPGCIICGMGSIKRSDAIAGPVPSPFG
ncbi:Transducin/WD40 repeat-like superfamily protein [Perilla frutescens var. hirtella]|uniref:Transducin/WD40 repeat-like superfamily protein n=1 Tax=Perilla frutescens var. hirtella TaxID=608512 RepID=A0AAD4P485_PERFH|nr:Transducin/WD40 repeat-like superfamily protein [Perilla frutescens var. hirtella]